MKAVKIELRNSLQDAREEVISKFVRNMMQAILEEGVSDVDFFEAIADYLDKKYGYKVTLVVEELIALLNSV